MGQIDLQHEAKVRGKRHHFVNPEADETRDGAAGHDKVQSVPRVNRSVSAAENFAVGRRGYVGACEFVQVDIPISCHHPIGDLLQQRQQCSQDGDIGLSLKPRARPEVHGNNHQPPLHPRQLNGNETAPFHAVRLDQARVGLPGCGNHKTPFVVVGMRGTGPKGMKPLTEKGGLCLRFLLKAEVRLLRKEAGRLGVLVPAEDFRPPLGNVSNR